jgi:4a-hydroxytetrahydrobiopterin dehydratase
MRLADEQCERANAVAPLVAEEARELARSVPLWTLSRKWIKREFKFDDFRQAMAFVNRVADAAEKQVHHPDIFISYDRVLLTLSTHNVGGLSRNDFILAARIDALRGQCASSAGER